MYKTLNKLQIIDILTLRFRNNPQLRAIQWGIPRFLNSVGNKSPFGTAVTIDYLYYNTVGSVYQVVKRYRESNREGPRGKLIITPFNLMRPEFRGHEILFWIELEKFHDTDSFFTETGLTESGERYYDFLLMNWETKKEATL